MFITLSDKRNEKLLIEWSGEISDQHAQDYCDVCNAVFRAHYDLDYMQRQYAENHYGKSFILLVYKDDRPVAAWSAWRCDLQGKVSFQLCNFATLPDVRKNGYILDMFYTICDEVRKISHDAMLYGFPNIMSWPVCKAFGFTVRELYLRKYTGRTKDFQSSIRMIEYPYIADLYQKNKDTYVCKVGKDFFIGRKFMAKSIIPAIEIFAQIEPSIAHSFKKAGLLWPLFYYSRERGIFRDEHKHMRWCASFILDSDASAEDYIQPSYMKDVFIFHRNGTNPR